MIDFIRQLIQDYGYVVLFIGAFLEGETVLVLAGIAASAGILKLPYVWLAAFAGSLAGDQLFFFIGRFYGRRLVERFPKWKPKIDKVLELVHRHRRWLIVSFRFFYGLRNPTPFALGMSDVKTRTFVLLNMLGAAAWAIAVGSAGYFMREAFLRMLDDIHRWTVVLLLLVALIAFIIWRIRRRKRLRAAQVASETATENAPVIPSGNTPAMPSASAIEPPSNDPAPKSR